MHEWLRYQLRSGALAGLLGHSRLFHYLTAAAPGVTELVTMGKVWDLAQPQRRTGGARFDTVIMDAPATGHALALLRAPRTYANVARVGPDRAARRRRSTRSCATRSATGVLSVALPEEMPVNETVDLERRLGDELGMRVDQIVANARAARSASRAAEVRRAGGAGARERGACRPRSPSTTGRRGQQEQLERLRAEARAPVITLPYLFEPELRRREVELLSDRLEEIAVIEDWLERKQVCICAGSGGVGKTRPRRRSRWAWRRAGARWRC